MPVPFINSKITCGNVTSIFIFRMPNADHRCLCVMQMVQITGERRASIRDRSKLQPAIHAIPLQHAQGILRNWSTYYTCPCIVFVRCFENDCITKDSNISVFGHYNFHLQKSTARFLEFNDGWYFTLRNYLMTQMSVI